MRDIIGVIEFRLHSLFLVSRKCVNVHLGDQSVHNYIANSVLPFWSLHKRGRMENQLQLQYRQSCNFLITTMLECK
jgi:hypothetical protein